MEEHVQQFMHLLRYAGYIKEERVKIQSFLRGLPLNYKEKNEFANPRILKETIGMARH
jgi:hypothetical protein